jgi:hypothetical protein
MLLPKYKRERNLNATECLVDNPAPPSPHLPEYGSRSGSKCQTKQKPQADLQERAMPTRIVGIGSAWSCKIPGKTAQHFGWAGESKSGWRGSGEGSENENQTVRISDDCKLQSGTGTIAWDLGPGTHWEPGEPLKKSSWGTELWTVVKLTNKHVLSFAADATALGT